MLLPHTPYNGIEMAGEGSQPLLPEVSILVAELLGKKQLIYLSVTESTTSTEPHWHTSRSSHTILIVTCFDIVIRPLHLGQTFGSLTIICESVSSMTCAIGIKIPPY